MDNIRLNRVIVALRRTAAFCDRWHWALLLLATPFLLFPSPSRLLILFIVPGLWIVAWIAGREPLPRTPLNVALLLMFCMVLVSLGATYDVVVSLPKISGMVLGVGVFFAVAREAARPRGWILSSLFFLGIGLGIATLGLFGTSWTTSKMILIGPMAARLPRFITGLQGAESGFNPNEVAGALIWALPLMIAINAALFFLSRPSKNEDAGYLIRKDWLEKMRGWRLVGVAILCLATTFFALAVFILTQSRGGYIGLALTLPALILIALSPKWRWYSLPLLALLVAVLGVLLASRWEAARIEIININSAPTPLSATTLDLRLEVWSRAIYGIQDFPFTGMGMNTFRKVTPALYPLFLIDPDSDISHSHNEFLQAALDLGIPGLIAFLALYIGAFWMLADIWRSTSRLAPDMGRWSPIIRYLTLGLCGGLFAHLLYGLTDAVALGAKPGVLFWMLLGLITGLHRQAQESWIVIDGSVPAIGAENGLRE